MAFERIGAMVGLVILGASCAQAAQSGTCTGLPADMRAARLHATGGPEDLRIERIALPQAGAGEVLVRVRYASVNPVDWKLQRAGRLPFPAVPGADFAGEVVARGEGVDTFACGAHVAGIVDQTRRSGSYAEYVAVPVGAIVRKPDAYSPAEAAAFPTVAVAAWRYLVQAAGVRGGERVLIHGGAGGVGSVAVQIAKARGAYVIATASVRNHDYLRSIGVDEVIDYRTTRFEDAVRGVDIVVDTVGGDTLTRSTAVLRDGGRLVSLVERIPDTLCGDGRITCPATPPWNVGEALEAIAPLIEAGRIRIHIERVYPLDQIVQAQQHNAAGATRGKVVVAIGDDAPRQAAADARGN